MNSQNAFLQLREHNCKIMALSRGTLLATFQLIERMAKAI